MWQRFTERARRAVFYAQEEAQRYHANLIDASLLLLGCLREPESMFGRTLQEMGKEPGEVEQAVRSKVTMGNHGAVHDITFTPEGKRIIDNAYLSARELNNDYIGTEHLLLGLLREGKSEAFHILAKLGLSYEAALDAARRLQARAESN